MNKKTRNYIIAAVVIMLGLITCAIAVNMGGGMAQGDMWDDELGQETNPVAGKVIEFSAEDLDGKTVDSSVFKDYDLTVINLWAPSCVPCVEEMPEIQKLYVEYAGKVNVLGVVEEYDKYDAPAIVKQQNVTYTNLVADDGLQEITKEFMYIPVTLFVNSEGEVLETFVPGATDYETFIAMVDELIANN